MTIGIPRALVYWKNPYFWESFFKNLDFETLLSPLTNKDIVEKGVKISDPETCFSNKVYWGHLLWLEGKCDLIFIPRLKVNKEKLEYCPKFFGIPDVAKILVKTQILTQTFDERKESFEKSLLKLGKKLKKTKDKVKRAQEAALLKERKIKEREYKSFFKKIQSKKPKIILVSHPYNLYDDYINLRMKEKLEKLGAKAIFIDEVPDNLNFCFNYKKSPSVCNVNNNPNKEPLPIDFHWEFGREIIEKIRVILQYDIAGAVEISSFACGCDAVLKEFVEKQFKTKRIPFLYLIIDEHTGEAGFQTRLEAFMDTLK